MAKNTDYRKILNDLEKEVVKEIKSNLKRLNRDFGIHDEAVEDELDFFSFSTCADNSIVEIKRDGTILMDNNVVCSLEKMIWQGSIPLSDAISILDDLRQLK